MWPFFLPERPAHLTLRQPLQQLDAAVAESKTKLIATKPGVERLFDGPAFHEAALRLDRPVGPVLEALAAQLGGPLAVSLEVTVGVVDARQDGFQERRAGGLVRQAEVNPASFLRTREQARVVQQLEVARDTRLPHVQDTHQILDGKITLADAYIKWYRTQEYYDSGDWRGTWMLDGGGALMNQSIHTIDLLYYLAGEVKAVCAYADRAIHEDIETEDNAVAIVKFQSGALGVIEGSTSCFSPTGHPAEVHMCGADGSIFMRDNSFTVWDFKRKRSSDKKNMQKFRAEPGEAGAGAADPSAIDFSGHQKNFEDAVRSLKRGEKPLIDGTEARKSIEIILAIYRSALTGGVAHDFNNMLGVILGHAELALEKAGEHQNLYANLKEIQTAAQRS